VNFNTLRFKLIWIHGLLIAVAIVCVSLARYEIASYRSRQSFDNALLHDARIFASHLQVGDKSFTVSAQNANARNASALQELEHYFILTNMEGRVFREDLHNRYLRIMFRRGELNEILRQHSGFGEVPAADGSAYRFVSLPFDTKAFGEVTVVHIGRSMEPLKGVAREYLNFSLYSVPLIIAVSALVGWLLAARALKPFEEITRTAEKITHENLNTQIVTEHKEEEIQRLVQSFNSMVQRLDESFQQMRKFNADVAHELRTPLAIIQGETEVALRSPNVPEEIYSVLSSNLEELDRLTRIVNDMLTLSEAEAGRQVLVKEPVNVRELLEDLVDQMRLLAMDRSIQIDVQGFTDLYVDADKLWIRRAVINLLDNAIKYSKPGGRIEVSASSHDLQIYLKIKDYGIGISQQDLPHIFDRLYRADPARSRDNGGAGLGLALVKWIIEAHNGTVHVASQPDLGTSFEITLPASTH
jgi:heavy metal sensor kinase